MIFMSRKSQAILFMRFNKVERCEPEKGRWILYEKITILIESTERAVGLGTHDKTVSLR